MVDNCARLPEEGGQIRWEGVSDTLPKAMLACYEPQKLPAEILRWRRGVRDWSRPRELGTPAPDNIQVAPAPVVALFVQRLRAVVGRDAARIS
jgi:hypothetical protein